MNDISGGQPNRLEPTLAWTVLTDAPLLGLGMAREAGLILAWDEADQLYLFDSHGERRSASRAPDHILAGAISDSGTLIALLGKGPRLWLLSADLEPISDRPAPSEAATLAIDTHGRYVALATRLKVTHFFTRHGRQAGEIETQQAMAHLCFVPNQPLLLATAAYGAILGIELSPEGAVGRLGAEVVWQQALMSNVGRLATTGDGGMVLASCFTHGVQRYDSRGHNDGSYHLGGTASHAIPDFAGRLIVVSTVEGELAVINGAGNVRWKTVLPRPACAVELDALGRYLVYGLPTGEITRIDLEKTSKGSRSRAAGSAPAVHSVRVAHPGPVRAPSWTAPVAQTDLQAETAVVAVLDEPPRVGFLTGRNSLQVFAETGQNLGQGPELMGTGRLLRTAPGWLAACTDRQVALYDAKRNSIQRLDLILAELTHLELRPETYGLAMVQERDRVGRLTPAARWIWKRELKSPVEDLAIGPGGATAVTTDNGQLLVFDAAGAPAGQFSATEAEALCLVEAPHGSPPNVAWVTLARRFQTLLGHDVSGRVVWQTPIPWQGWDLVRLETVVIVTAADGRALAFDGAGQVKAQSREGDTLAVYAEGAGEEPWLVSRQGVHLICSDMSGRVHWRAVADAPLGPIAAGRTGVAVMIGRSLAWFPSAGAPKV
jgi:hypothetical protein